MKEQEQGGWWESTWHSGFRYTAFAYSSRVSIVAVAIADIDEVC